MTPAKVKQWPHNIASVPYFTCWSCGSDLWASCNCCAPSWADFGTRFRPRQFALVCAGINTINLPPRLASRQGEEDLIGQENYFLSEARSITCPPLAFAGAECSSSNNSQIQIQLHRPASVSILHDNINRCEPLRCSIFISYLCFSQRSDLILELNSSLPFRLDSSLFNLFIIRINPSKISVEYDQETLAVLVVVVCTPEQTTPSLQTPASRPQLNPLWLKLTITSIIIFSWCYRVTPTN